MLFFQMIAAMPLGDVSAVAPTSSTAVDNTYDEYISYEDMPPQIKSQSSQIETYYVGENGH